MITQVSLPEYRGLLFYDHFHNVILKRHERRNLQRVNFWPHESGTEHYTQVIGHHLVDVTVIYDSVGGEGREGEGEGREGGEGEVREGGRGERGRERGRGERRNNRYHLSLLPFLLLVQVFDKGLHGTIVGLREPVDLVSYRLYPLIRGQSCNDN